MKKFLSMILLAVLLLSMLCVCAYAEADEETATVEQTADERHVMRDFFSNVYEYAKDNVAEILSAAILAFTYFFHSKVKKATKKLSDKVAETKETSVQGLNALIVAENEKTEQFNELIGKSEALTALAPVLQKILDDIPALLQKAVEESEKTQKMLYIAYQNSNLPKSVKTLITDVYAGVESADEEVKNP